MLHKRIVSIIPLLLDSTMFSVHNTSSAQQYPVNVDFQNLKGNIIDVNVESMSDSDREAFLLQWTTERCGEDGTTFTFDEGWDMIKRFGLNVLSDMLKEFLLKNDGIHKKERRPLGNRGWSALYTTSYQMVNINISSGELFYDRISKFISDYVNSPNIQGPIAEASLSEFIAIWQSYKIMMKWIWHLFMHLETSVIKLNELLTLTAVALVHFHKFVYERYHDRLATLALNIIQREREGELVDRSLLQESLQIFLTMGLASKIDTVFATEKRDGLKNIDSALKLQEHNHLYLQHFEANFLEESRMYYRRKSTEWLISMDIPAYILLLDSVMHQEDGRCTAYLNAVTRTKLMRVVLEECVVARRDTIFDSVREILYATYDNAQHAEGYMLPVNKALVVERLFRFCTQCQALDSRPEYALADRLCSVFQSYVVELGMTVIETRRAEVTRLAEESKTKKTASEATAADPHTIESILRLFKFVPEIVHTALNDDITFAQGAKEAFSIVMNADMGKFSVMQMLAAYCDNLLKGSFKMTEAEVDVILQRCMSVFGHLIDKDMFADLHRNYLAKRLIGKRSVSSDAEKLIVGLMKMQCGAQFTSKIEGMLYDYQLAGATQAEYETVLCVWQPQQSLDVRQIVFNNTLLTASYWPTQKPREFNYPTEMISLQMHFTEWYKGKFGVRSLQWVATLGDVSVAVSMKNREYEVTITVLQAVVLRCFHQLSDELTFSQIATQSGIKDEEVLKRVLHSLACQKYKLLLRGSESKSLTHDNFRANTGFTNKLKKFRVPMAALDDTETGASRHVLEDRTNFVDASIVRIMKSRKILAHSELQFEVMRQLIGFQPEVRFIKQRIESLIERDFLERDTNDARCYKYVP